MKVGLLVFYYSISIIIFSFSFLHPHTFILDFIGLTNNVDIIEEGYGNINSLLTDIGFLIGKLGIVIFIVYKSVEQTYKGSKSLLSTILSRKITKDRLAQLHSSLSFCLGLFILTNSMFSEGLWDVTKNTAHRGLIVFDQHLNETVSKQIENNKIEKNKKLANATVTEGTIIDKFNCVSCSSVGDIYPISSNHYLESLYLFRIGETQFSIDQETWKNLKVGDTVRVAYTENEVLKIDTQPNSQALTNFGIITKEKGITEYEK